MLNHDLSTATGIAAAVVCALLAAMVAFQRRDTKGRAFVFLASMIALWNVYFVLLRLLPCDALSWIRLRPLAVPVNLIPVAILYFTVVNQEDRGRFWHGLVWFNLTLAAVLVGASPFGLVVRDLKEGAFGCASVPGPLYHVYTASVAICSVAAFTLCVRDVRNATNPRNRLVARFWLISAAVGLPLGVTNLLPSYGIPIYPLGSLGSAAWASIIAYAMIRHRLLDVEIWVSRIGTAVAAGLLTVVPAYALLLALQVRTLGDVQVDLSSAIFLTLLLVAAVFPTLQRRLEKAFAKRAFPSKFEQQASLEMLRRAVLREQNRDRLLETVAKGLRAVFRPPTIAIFTRHAEGVRLRLGYHLGERPQVDEFSLASALVAELEDATLSLLQSELSESKRARGREVGQLMERLGWTVCVPIKKERRSVAGFLALGLKEGKDWYMLTELEALEALGEELALALENIQLHEQAALARQALERVERLSALGTMVAGIVHEVRNPLVAFSTFMQLAEEHKTSPELIETSAPVVVRELNRVQRLLDELLRATRSNPPSFAEVDLGKCVSDIAEVLKPAAKQARVVLQPNLPAEPLAVFADADRVRQVLFNLGLNAIEAAPEGSTVTITVTCASKNGRRYGEVRVRDTGPGLPPELREKVFQPFFTTKADGTGLGLALCLQIAEDHAGYLEIRDPEGPGVIFAVGFPEFVREVHGPLIDGATKDEPELTTEEEAHMRSLVGNIKLPPEVLRLARQIRTKS